MKDFKTILKDDLKRFRFSLLIKDVMYYARIKMKRDNLDNYRYIAQGNDFIRDTELIVRFLITDCHQNGF